MEQTVVFRVQTKLYLFPLPHRFNNRQYYVHVRQFPLLTKNVPKGRIMFFKSNPKSHNVLNTSRQSLGLALSSPVLRSALCLCLLFLCLCLIWVCAVCLFFCLSSSASIRCPTHLHVCECGTLGTVVFPTAAILCVGT